jgi:sulfite reductase alpha subunit-like flavoprotein
MEAGALARVPVAFSRDGPPGEAKTYVQTVLRQPGPSALVRQMLLSGGYMFVAGAAGAMPRDVREAIRDALCGGGEGGMSEEEADGFVRALERTGRYQVEVWG